MEYYYIVKALSVFLKKIIEIMTLIKLIVLPLHTFKKHIYNEYIFSISPNHNNNTCSCGNSFNDFVCC